MNCCSLSLDKFDHIQILLEEINKSTCISELALQDGLRFTDMMDITQYDLLKYNHTSVKSKSSKHGGLVLYVNSSFTYSIEEFPHTNK